MFSVFKVVLCVLLVTACGSSKSSSKSTISTTRVRPPVQEILPSSLLADGSFSLANGDLDNSKTCQTDASAGDACSSLSESSKIRCIVKNRLFCGGPTEVLKLLDGLDGRLAGIEARSEGSEIACMSKDPVDLTDQLDFPGEAVLPAKFKCQDSSIGLGFGDADGVWYVREANGAAAQSFVVNTDSSIHGFIWLPSKEGTMASSTGLLEIQTDTSAKTIEITGGGVGFGFCGLHYKSNADFIYLKMNPDGVGSSCDYDSNNVTDSSDWVEACLDAGSLDDATAQSCDSLKEFSLATLGRNATTGTGTTTSFAAVAPLDDETVVKFELNNYLNALFTNSATFTDVPEFK